MKYFFSIFLLFSLTLSSFCQEKAVIDNLKNNYKKVKVFSNYITAKEKKGDKLCLFNLEGTLLYKDDLPSHVSREMVYGGKKYYFIAGSFPGKDIAFVDENGNLIISKPHSVEFIENAPRQLFLNKVYYGSPMDPKYEYAEVYSTDGSLIFKSLGFEYIDPIYDDNHLFFLGLNGGYYRLLDSNGKELIPRGDHISQHKFGGNYYFESWRPIPDSQDRSKFHILFDETGHLLPGIRNLTDWYIELDGEVFFILHKYSKGFGGKIQVSDEKFVYSPVYGELMPWTDDDTNLVLRPENGKKLLVKSSASGAGQEVELGVAQVAQAFPQQKQPESVKPKTNEASTKSRGDEIDVNIPRGISSHPNTFALIIANENYRREESVPFAINDGETFASYLKTTLGVPEKNIQLYTDASLNDIKFGINRLAQICDAYGSDASVIVYYAGHGIPDEKSLDAYLLPVDGYGSDPSTGFSLNNLYEALGKMPAKQTMLLLDACFSGSQRSGKMMAGNARGVRLKPKTAAASGNMIVLSATQGDETAYPFENHSHGMFTYFLLKKLNETNGEVTLGDLSDYIITNVKRASVINNEKIQTPSVSASPALSSSWRSMRFGE